MAQINIEISIKIIKKIIKEKYGTQKEFCRQKNEHAGHLSTLLKNNDPKRPLTPKKILILEEKLSVPLGSILFPNQEINES